MSKKLSREQCKQIFGSPNIYFKSKDCFTIKRYKQISKDKLRFERYLWTNHADAVMVNKDKDRDFYLAVA